MSQILVTLNINKRHSKKELLEKIRHISDNEMNHIRINLKSFTKDDISRCSLILETLKEFRNMHGNLFKVYIDIPYPRKKNRLFTNHDINILYGDTLEFTKKSIKLNSKFVEIVSDESLLDANISSKFIYYGDGEGMFEVVKHINGEILKLKALNSFKIYRDKSLSVINRSSDPLQPWQINYLKKICDGMEVSAFMLSFCESGTEIVKFRKLIGSVCPDIYGKIETTKGFENIDEIIEYCKGIVVARGDLALYCKISDLLIMQTEIARKTKEANKELIIATDILNSLVDINIPIRAEIMDYLHIQSHNPDFICIKASFMAKERLHILKRFINEANGCSEEKQINFEEPAEICS